MFEFITNMPLQDGGGGNDANLGDEKLMAWPGERLS